MPKSSRETVPRKREAGGALLDLAPALTLAPALAPALAQVLTLAQASTGDRGIVASPMVRRVLVLACCLAILLFAASACASPPEERPWEEQQQGGLSASRHAVTTASVNVFLMPWSAGLWLANGRSQTRIDWKSYSYVIGSLNAAGSAANLGWLVVSGASLREYKRRSGKWMTVRLARTHVSFTTIDTAFRASGVIGGAIALGNGNRGTGIAMLAPNAALLPFHIWALYATSRELRYRKRETRSVARRIQPTPSGFRF